MNVASTQATYAKAQADLAAANARFADVKSHMSEAAVNAYMHGGNTSMVEELVTSRNAGHGFTADIGAAAGARPAIRRRAVP